jgi:hypothetical protein
MCPVQSVTYVSGRSDFNIVVFQLSVLPRLSFALFDRPDSRYNPSRSNLSNNFVSFSGGLNG